MVAAIDEKTSNRVWRKVVELFSKQASEVVDVVVENRSGDRSTIRVTKEHPFHLEGWDGKMVHSLMAALGDRNELPSHIVMPSDGKTPFGLPSRR